MGRRRDCRSARQQCRGRSIGSAQRTLAAGGRLCGWHTSRGHRLELGHERLGTRPALPQGRWFSGGATVGSAFYVGGGHTDPGPPTNTNQRYLEVPCTTPTATPTGTLTTPTPTPVVCGVGHWQEQASIRTLLLGNALVGQGGHLYSFGGVGFGMLEVIHEYAVERLL